MTQSVIAGILACIAVQMFFIGGTLVRIARALETRRWG